MAETWEKTPNVEGLSQSKWSSNRVELSEIQSELNKAVSSPNPSKAPLNYIDNLDERKVVQKELLRQLARQQRELEAVLQLSDDKETEIALYREEKAKLDIELQKTIWSMEFTLVKDAKFLKYIEEKITKAAENKLVENPDNNQEVDTENDVYEEGEENEEEQNTVQLKLFLLEKNGQKFARAVSPIELTDEQKEVMTQSIIEWFLEKWENIAGVEFELESEKNPNTIQLKLFTIEKDGQNFVKAVSPVELTDEQKETMTQTIINKFLDEWKEIAGVEYEIQIDDEDPDENEDDNLSLWSDIMSQEDLCDLEELPPILQSFFLLTNPIIINCFENILDDNDKRWLNNLRENLQKLSDKYNELKTQIKYLSSKIDYLEDEQIAIDDKSVEYEQKLSDLGENIWKINQWYFLDSYQSTKKVSLDDFVATPTVEKQINYILELNKRWLSVPKTILLYWWHNLWKTYTANVLATELHRKMYHIKSCDIKNSEFSDAGAMLDAIFSWAIEKKEPCIIFLDEIEKFSKWLEWSIYQDEIENTIRHHISKIKESSLDIMIIWAISDKSKIDTSLMKQDVFSKQIDFEPLWDDRCMLLFQKIMKKKNLVLWDEVILQETISKLSEKNPEYIKKFVETIADCHLLNTLDSENNIVSQEDIDEAIKIMWAYSRNSSWTPGYNR